MKAVEYFIKEKFDERVELHSLKEYIHFTCTSEDINNLAYGMMMKDSLTKVICPKLESLITILNHFAESHAIIAMMSRTHG